MGLLVLPSGSRIVSTAKIQNADFPCQPLTNAAPMAILYTDQQDWRL